MSRTWWFALAFLFLLAFAPVAVSEEDDHGNETHEDHDDHGNETHDDHGNETHDDHEDHEDHEDHDDHDDHDDHEDHEDHDDHDDHDDHTGHEDHDDHAHEGLWEWAGVFPLVAGETYTWTATRGANGKYADASMKVVAIKASSGSGGRLRRLSGSADEQLHDAEAHAEEFFEMGEANWTNVTSGSMLQISDEVAFKMEFDDHTWMSLFHMQVSSSGSFVFFAEHLPSEFENGFHFFKDEHGDDLEAIAQEPGGENSGGELSTSTVSSKNGSMGMAILAALVTALPGCFMIVIVAGLVKSVQPEYFGIVYSFASGAIFACAVFLLLAEGLHLAGAGQDEVTGTWTWGVAIMLGWLIGMFIHHSADIVFKPKDAGKGDKVVVANPSADAGNEVAPAEAEAGAHQQDSQDISTGTNIAVAGPVLFGDFWHNLVDGMVVGFACKACSSSMTWAIVGATVAHEVPQEIADFFVLVTKAGMPWMWALLANSVTAVSAVVIGAIIAYGTDVSMNFEGLCLAFGGGVYLFVALTELADAMVHMKKPSPLGSLLRFAAFAVGAMSVGLVLLDHQHCVGGTTVVAEGGAAAAVEDPHAGHDHR